MAANKVKKDWRALKDLSEKQKNNPTIVKLAVAQNGQALKFASDELKRDRAIVLVAVSQRGDAWRALSYASPELKQDREVVTAAVQHNGSALQFAAPVLKGDRDVVLEAVAQNGDALKHASEQLRADRDVVLEAVKQHYSSLEFASEQLRGDRDFMLEAVEQHFCSLRFASEELQGDRDVVLEAVKQHYSSLAFASEQLRGDRDFMLEAVEQHYSSLRFASEQLQGDRDLVLEAVKRSGSALEYASEELQGDRDVVLEAVKQHYSSLEFASEELQGDRDVVLEAVKQHYSSLEFASEQLRGDRDFMLEAVEQHFCSLRFASEELQGDRDLVLEAVKQHYSSLEFASEELQGDRDVVLEAVKQHYSSLEFASEQLRGDRDFMLEAVKWSGSALEYASEELQGDRDVVLEAVKHRFALEYASEELQADRGVVLEAVKQDGSALKHASEELRGDHGIVLRAVKKNSSMLKFASEQLQCDREFMLAVVEHLIRRTPDDGSGYVDYVGTVKGMLAACKFLSLDKGGLKSDLAARLEEWYEREAAPKRKKKKTDGGLAEPVASTSGGAGSGKKKLKPSQPAPGSKKQNMGSASSVRAMSRDEMVATHECLLGSSPGSNMDDDELRSRLLEFVKPHLDGWEAAFAVALRKSVFQFLTSCGRTDADAKRVASARLQSCSTAAAQRAMWDKLSSEYCPRAPAPPDRSSAGKVLVIAPGFGIMATPAQLRTLQNAYGSAIVCSNQHANPEEADFDMAEGILPILHEIKHHKPKAILCASKGGLYMRELWRLMEAGGHDHLKGIAYLMINAPPDLTQLPQGVKIILVQGAKEEKWPRLRGYLNTGRFADSSLEALIRTGSPGMCYFYYTAEVNSNWGYRKGDTHVPTSLLLHDCLPRLVDSLLATSSSPGAAFQASSRAFLSSERLAAENGLGWHPETLSSRFEGTEMRVEVPPHSAEFKHVECIFKADPASGVDRFYFPGRGTSNFNITKIERVQNAALKDTVDDKRGRVVKMLKSAGIRYEAGVHSRWLFHGAKDADALQNIIENPVSGFAPQMGLGAGGVNLWGYGTYFARDASYSIRAHYCDDCLDEEEDHMILLCLVECGLSCVGEEHMRIMPKVHPALKQLPYTSYVDFASNPEIFVTMGEQAYPAYIIHFED